MKFNPLSKSTTGLAAALAVVFALSALVGAGSRSRRAQDAQRLRRPRFHDLSEARRQEGEEAQGHHPTNSRSADKSSSHNFHLKGPGYNKAITSVGFTGHKDGHDQAQEGHLPLRVRPALELHEGQLQGRLTRLCRLRPASRGSASRRATPLPREARFPPGLAAVQYGSNARAELGARVASAGLTA